MNCKILTIVFLTIVVSVNTPVLAQVSNRTAPAAQPPVRTNSPLRNHIPHSAAYVPPVTAKTQKHIAPYVEQYLITGELSKGESDLKRKLRQNPDDDQLRFGLGMLQFLSGVEGLMQDIYRYGLSSDSRDSFFARRECPVEKNPEPELLTYLKLRAMVERFSNSLERSDRTLSKVTDAGVKLPLHFGKIKLDLNGNGYAGDSEALWRLYLGVTNSKIVSEEKAEKFMITFDKGDVHWLRGYCHLLSSFCDIFLAYDSKQTFECCSHLLFANVDSPYKFLTLTKHPHRHSDDDVKLVDLIAIVHTLQWEVKEPVRMRSALYHLESCVAQGEQTWSHILAEKDDDREWIPNPYQTGVIPDVEITQKRVDAWLNFMGVVKKILKGDLLITFWRGDEGYGVNVRRVFLEPKKLDIALWVQGTAAAPYLEKGPLTKMETMEQLSDAFGRQFPGFAAWFN